MRREKEPETGSYDYFIMLGMTPDEARGLVKSWAFQPPVIKDAKHS